MNRQLEQQNQALSQQAQVIDIERARVQALSEQLGQQSQSSRPSPVFDTRGIGRPPQFDGKMVEWTSWEFELRSWLGARFRDGEASRLGTGTRLRRGHGGERDRAFADSRRRRKAGQPAVGAAGRAMRPKHRGTCLREELAKGQRP